MQTVPQARQPSPGGAITVPALTGALDRVGSAQSRAIVRWHQRTALCQLNSELTDNPAWPLINTSDNPRHFAPPRSVPQGAA